MDDEVVGGVNNFGQASSSSTNLQSVDDVAMLSVVSGSVAKYLKADGQNLLDRLTPLTEWLNACSDLEIDPYCKQSDGPILAECSVRDRYGRKSFGINMASQDYLALSSHKLIKDAAQTAVENYGVHSAGSPALMGNSAPSIELEYRLAEFLGMKECTVFATGWAAGYGVIKALVKETDHILIDRLSHASLMEGARNATRNFHVFSHLSTKSLESRLKRIRAANPDAGILVVTESLFSMDSDTPDLALHQSLASQYGATLMVDAAHDMGCIGPTGRGHLEVQGMVGKIDILMGSFSKTFASNGGYVASNHPGLKLALRAACGPHTFSNAISPVQAKIVIKAIEIIGSEEGANLRKSVFANSVALRTRLTELGFEVLGETSPIVPVVVGSASRARLAFRKLMQTGGFVNLVEYPAVGKNESRFRLQVMSSHTPEQIEVFSNLLEKAVKSADGEMVRLGL